MAVVTTPSDALSTSAGGAATRLRAWVGGATIQGRLVRNFSVVILVPAIITAVVGVSMIRQRVFDQAQAQVDSDLEAARAIFAADLDRLKDAIRIHATRMVIYAALQRRDLTGGLAEEMDRIRRAEQLDVLTIVDAEGRAFYRSRNPGLAGDDVSDEIVHRVLKGLEPVAATEVVPGSELIKEGQALARQAFTPVTPTARARARSQSTVTSGMMMRAAAPILTPSGRQLGALVGAVLLNRNYEVVDKVRHTVFKEGEYDGLPLGTATIFLDDVRVSTNVRNADGSRAIGTQVSAEVAEAVLDRGETWRGRAFVVNDWYLSAYTPITDLGGRTIGMLYVGVLERPFMDSLWRSLLVFLGIAIVGVVLVQLAAMRVATRISGPIHEMSGAAHRVAQGDFSATVSSESDDELGQLARNFNTMTAEVARARQVLVESADELERKVARRTAELRRVQAHLIQSEKMTAVGKLAAGVAHEINNPLTGILTNSSLMLEDLPADHSWREDLQTIVNETLRCRKIVKGLLDFARQTKPQRALLSLNQIIEDVLALVRNQTVFKNIRVVNNLDPTLPTVLADADQMRQVVLNIVLNAADVMPQGGELRVESRHHAETGRVEVRVTDTGPGMPEEIISRVFEPFFTTKKTGTGLGLSIAHGIVERHAGQLRVTSAPGKGTTFTIDLPVTGAVDDE
ncbi:MAG: cache domain-containing protein [Acidobacteriota bacterium]